MTVYPDDDIVFRALIQLLSPELLSGSQGRVGEKNAPNFSANRPELNTPGKVCSGRRTCAHVTVVERLSTMTISVTWSDPTLGHFADQVWRKGVAHTNAYCALTGIPIRRGDAVFRPRSHDFAIAANDEHMILASSIRGMSGEVQVI